MLTTIIIIVGVLIVLAVFFSFVPMRLWISALAAGVTVSIFTLIGMRTKRFAAHRHTDDKGVESRAGRDHQHAGNALSGRRQRRQGHQRALIAAQR